MNLIEWKPFREIDEFFSDAVRPVFPALTADLAVDVYGKKDNVIAQMNLPGVDMSEINVSIEDDILHISGTRKEEKETEEKDYYSKEIRRGSFTRAVRLPRPVEASGANAEYKDGVLTVMVPVKPGAKSNAVKVPIKS